MTKEKKMKPSLSKQPLSVGFVYPLSSEQSCDKIFT